MVARRTRPWLEVFDLPCIPAHCAFAQLPRAKQSNTYAVTGDPYAQLGTTAARRRPSTIWAAGRRPLDCIQRTDCDQNTCGAQRRGCWSAPAPPAARADAPHVAVRTLWIAAQPTRYMVAARAEQRADHACGGCAAAYAAVRTTSNKHSQDPRPVGRATARAVFSNSVSLNLARPRSCGGLEFSCPRAIWELPERLPKVQNGMCRCAAHRARILRVVVAGGARNRVRRNARAAHLIRALLCMRNHHVPCGMRRSVQRAAGGPSCAGARVPRRGVTCARWLPCGTCMAAGIGPLITIRGTPISRPYCPRAAGRGSCSDLRTLRPSDTLGEYGAPYAGSAHRGRR
jgi:hypothetical protein